jgi:hypothetical protein
LDGGTSLFSYIAVGADFPSQNIRRELRRPEKDIAINMTRLAVIVGDFTQDSQLSLDAAAPNYERHLHALEEWASALPQNLREFGEHVDNVQQSDLPKDDEFSSVSQKQQHELLPVLNSCSSTWRHSTSLRFCL